MLWKLSQPDQWKIVSAIHDAVAIGFAQPGQAEPQLIANLVRHLPEKLNQVTLETGHDLKTGGVFIHAQPFVGCQNFPDPSPQSVELGDLLLVRTGIHNGKVHDRRALLLQAKKTSDIPATPDNANQHHLYATWPTFTYVRSGPQLNGKKRHVRGPNPYSGAKYFLIGERPVPGYCHNPLAHLIGIHEECQLHLAEPTQPAISAYRCFYQEMLDFILGNTGREYLTPPPNRTRGWDRVIEDLLSQTAGRTSAYARRAGTTGGVRGQGVMFIAGEFGADGILVGRVPVTILQRREDDIPPAEIPENWPEGEGEGISIIEFVASSEGEDREK